MKSQILKNTFELPRGISIYNSSKLKNAFLIFTCLFSFGLSAQVGINNSDPKSTLDITASNVAAPSNTDGILIPRIDAFPASDPGAEQLGMMVFLTTTDGTDPPGFYYWNHPTTSWEWANRIKKIDDLSDGKSDNDGSNDGSSVFLGEGSGANDDSSDNKNIGLGYQSLNAVTSGTNNVAIGYQALLVNTGNSNVAIGKGALSSNAANNANTAIGINALKDNIANGNTAIGVNALKVNTTGTGNTGLGGYSLDANIDGNNNMSIGAFSLSKLTGGNGNTAIGPYALSQYTGVASTNTGNTAIGNLSVNQLTSGIANTGVGFESLRFTTSGGSNTAIGHFAGFHAGRDGTQIDDNILIGKSSGYATTGSKNVYVGKEAGGYFVSGGTGNPPSTYSTGSSNVFIGYKAGANSTAGAFSDKLIIENTSSTTPLLYGEFDNDVLAVNWDTTGSAPTSTLSVNGTTEATDFKVTALNTAPASASDTGTTGEIRITASYIYICTATNTWVRASLASW